LGDRSSDQVRTQEAGMRRDAREKQYAGVPGRHSRDGGSVEGTLDWLNDKRGIYEGKRTARQLKRVWKLWMAVRNLVRQEAMLRGNLEDHSIGLKV